MKRYLVTGGAGFLGAALIRRLVQQGHQVRVLDNQSRGNARRLREVWQAIEFLEADIRDAEAVERAVRGVDAVCHLAFINGTELFYAQPELVLEVGLKGMVHLVDACVRHGVGELLLISSSEVYQTPSVIPTNEQVALSIPDPLNPRYSYAAAKIASEVMAINYGRTHLQRVVIIRPHNVYGPDMGWEHVIPQFVVRMRRLAQGTPTSQPIQFPIQGTGEETRAFVFIDDAAEGMRLALERGAHLGIYHLGTTEELSVATVAQMVGAYFGRQVQVVPGPLSPGSPRRRCPDITKLSALGYQPAVPFAQGLLRTARWYHEHADEQPAAMAGGRA